MQGKKRMVVWFAAILAMFVMTVPAFGAELSKKVLLIGVDGVLADLVRKGIDDGFLSNYKELKEKGACVSYDITSTKAADGKYNTISGANWTALLTGTEYDVHGVTGNVLIDKESFTTSFSGFKAVPTTAAILGEKGFKSSMFVEWVPLAQTFGRYFNYHYPQQKGVTDGVAKAAVRLSADDDEYTFVHIDLCDTAAHRNQFDADLPAYRDAVVKSDSMIRDLVKAVQCRANVCNEYWRIFITTDHGGYENKHDQFDNPLVYASYLVVADLKAGEWQKVETGACSKAATVADIPGMIVEFLGEK